MIKKMILLATMAICVSAMVACSDSGSSGYCYCYSKSQFVDQSQMNSTAESITSEEGCSKYDSGSAGYFSCSWIEN